ncbi:MAG: hypothetical protein H0T46_00880 [Deltaproteobacteria bacterium]|nr:hypothetical protein [Deltaproteobacteria bacterium]
MRTILTALTLSLVAPAALAAPGDAAPAAKTASDDTTIVVLQPSGALPPMLTPIVAETTPARCRPMIKRTQVPSLTQQLPARIALASCVADAAMQPLQLIDGQESVLAIEQATAPAFALLDNVIDVGDASVKIVALRNRADLYGQMSAKMMMTVPPLMTNTPEAAALRDTRKQIVEGMVEPWKEMARSNHQAIVDLGRHHPELVKNPVAQTAIRDSERQLAIPVATR